MQNQRLQPFSALSSRAIDHSPCWFNSYVVKKMFAVVLHVECISKIPRILVVKEGGHGTLAWIDVIGFLDLSLPPSPPPSPPLPPAPGFIPVLSSSEEDSLEGFTDDTVSDRMSFRSSPISVLAGPGGSSFVHASQEIAAHVNPSEEVLMALPETMLEQVGASAMLLLGRTADGSTLGDQTPTPTLPAPGLAMTGGLEDIVRPILSEDEAGLVANPTNSPELQRKEIAWGTSMDEVEVYDLSALFTTPPPQMSVPQEALAPVVETAGPRRSKRVAEQSDGGYINAVDRAVQKKARDVHGIGEGTQGAQKKLKIPKKAKSSATDAGPAAIAPLQVGDLLYLGKACGFAGAELVKLEDAAKRYDDE
jgi:hypothetical protein